MAVVNLTASAFSTTGSIPASSTSLTVADASGFAVNDYLIVEIGGEAGVGARGTVGVGGAWPDLSYASAAAMNADTGKPDGQYAWRTDTGNVYRSFSGVWTQQTYYYWAKVIPRSLVARVTAKAGNVLTLSVSAAVAATNAKVYYDNYPVFNAHASDAIGTEIVWPAGNFALSDMCWMQDRSNWHIHGTSKTATKLFFPKGISAVALIDFAGGSGNRVSNLCVQGNALAQGYMIAWNPPGTDQTTARAHYGIFFSGQTNGIISDTKSIDTFQGAVISACTNTSVYRHDAVLTEGLQEYVQWAVQGADSIGGEFADCTVTSAKLTAGIEWFRSSGNIIRNYTGSNATMSLNSVDNWQIINPSIIIAPNSQLSQTSFGKDQPIIVISNTIGGAYIANGGVLTNASITIQGYINAANDVLAGIVITSADVVNVRIVGGTYAGPDYAAPSTLFGPQGIRSTGGNTQVSCFTCRGQIAAGTATVNRANIGVDSGSITYCRGGSIYGSPGVTLTGNGIATAPLNAACGRQFALHCV